MLPFNPGGHAVYQDFLVAQLRKYYPDPSIIPQDTWEVMEHSKSRNRMNFTTT